MDLAIAEHANIASKIYEIRGLKVMLDRDLAELYQIETKYLNRMVSRNKKRFPEKYMFQLTKEEVDYLRCQFVTANISTKSRALPFVFTEHGTLQASSILNSNIAIEVNHKIIEAFVELRKQITISSQYETLLEKIKYIESRQEVGELSQKIDIKTISDKVTKLSQDNFRFSKLLDEFQNVHTILKKSDMLDDNMKELN